MRCPGGDLPPIQVTFNVSSGNYTHVIAFPAHATVEQIKKTLHADLRLVEEFLVLRVGGVVANNGDSLMDLGFVPACESVCNQQSRLLSVLLGGALHCSRSVTVKLMRGWLAQ